MAPRKSTDPIEPSSNVDNINALNNQIRPFLGMMPTASPPASGILFGTQAIISDSAAAPALGGTSTGSGSLKIPVTFIGTGWING
jgi:hypothetical protein